MAELLADEEIQAVTANCMVVLPDSEMQRGRSISDALSWGIDRIDSRSGTDGQYDDSGATGSGSLVYILDMGAPIVHPSDPLRVRLTPLRPCTQVSASPTTTLADAPWRAGRRAALLTRLPAAAIGFTRES